MTGRITTFYELKPTRFGRLLARLILFTPLGRFERVTTLHWWALRRLPRLFYSYRRVDVR